MALHRSNIVRFSVLQITVVAGHVVVVVAVLSCFALLGSFSFVVFFSFPVFFSSSRFCPVCLLYWRCTACGNNIFVVPLVFALAGARVLILHRKNLL